MGRTLPSITQAYLEEHAEFARFRRALRRSDQAALDELFAMAHQHLAALAYAAHSLPFEAMLLAMLLEEHKAVFRLRQMVEAAQGAAQEATQKAGGNLAAGYLSQRGDGEARENETGPDLAEECK